jgi:UDP-N-acetyl-D-glucosamine dehydrogenase
MSSYTLLDYGVMLMLLDKITAGSTKVAVVGLGYVGLPLALLCAQKGFAVTGIDKDESRVKKIEAGKSYVSNISHEKIKALVSAGKLQATTGYDTIDSCDIIFICVQTPLTESKRPDYSYLLQAVNAVSEKLGKQQLIIVESTIAPGTTLNMILPALTKNKLRVGEDFFLAYSPERIDPGNKLFHLQNVPKLVAGVTDHCRIFARSFYKKLDIPTIHVSSIPVAELSKLLENTYRDVNIAFINEMAQVCHRNGINIWEVVEAAATKPYGFQAFYPGPGVGGHCIPVDSVYYTSWASETGAEVILAEYARKINANMPHYVVERLEATLKERKKQVSGNKIMVLGVTYKKDVDDFRESPIIQVMEMLVSKGAKLSFHDPFLEELAVGGTLIKCADLEEYQVAQQDCVVLGVPHSGYDTGWIKNACPLVFDLTGSMPEGDNVVKL